MSIKDEERKAVSRNTALGRRIDSYVTKLRSIFLQADEEYSKLAAKADYSNEVQFRWSDFPKLKKEADKVTKSLAAAIKNLVLASTLDEWSEANKDIDKEVRDLLLKSGVKAEQLGNFSNYFRTNLGALKAFQQRKSGGLGLSDRVWNIAKNREVETELCVSVSEGRSAKSMATVMKKYLNQPDKLFRRVRDKYGELQLSKNAKAYHSGQGVYRSSYRNALRLTRTETNMAYRSAEMERYSDLDFIVGYEVKRSKIHYDCPVCDDLAGKYPKTFKFMGWHPSCRCYVVPILNTNEEFEAQNEAIMAGDEPKTVSSREVKDLPDGFKAWYKENKERIDGARKRGTLPWFLKDNEKLIK